MKENQLALTSGIQDIMTLNRELLQITEEGGQDLIANIENRFDVEDRDIIKKLGLNQQHSSNQILAILQNIEKM